MASTQSVITASMGMAANAMGAANKQTDMPSITKVRSTCPNPPVRVRARAANAPRSQPRGLDAGTTNAPNREISLNWLCGGGRAREELAARP